jgi:Zn-dependent peptidase ImmA (M78 family)
MNPNNVDANLQIYSDQREEIEANWFAAILLMPAKEFNKIWLITNENIVDVANYFNVSKLAASIRANDLNLLKL